MTQFPEQVLARELEVCYAGISLITDYDVGLEGTDGIEPVSHEAVLEVFNANNDKLKTLLLNIISQMPAAREWRRMPEMTAAEQRRLPSIDAVRAGLGGRTRVETIPIPVDCTVSARSAEVVPE